MPASRDLPTSKRLASPAAAVSAEPGFEMTVAEAAAALAVDARTVRRWAASGKLASRRVRGPRGNELRLDGASVTAFRLLRSSSTPPEKDAHTDQAGEGESVAVTIRSLNRALEGNVFLSADVAQSLNRALDQNALLQMELPPGGPQAE